MGIFLLHIYIWTVSNYVRKENWFGDKISLFVAGCDRKSDVTRQNPFSGFLTRSDTKLTVQPQKMARDLKFQIEEVEGLYYLCCKNKGADQLRSLICAFVFAYAKIRFSHDTAQMYRVIQALLAF